MMNLIDHDELAPAAEAAGRRQGTEQTHCGQGDEMTKALFREAMRGNWKKVLDIYRQDKEARTAKITRTQETVLHVAVSEGNADVVNALLDSMGTEEAVKVLRMTNEMGNTALHSAAVLGMVDICASLSAKCPALITQERNHHGETPLFVAVNFGKKEVFFALQAQIDAHNNVLNKAERISYCRRSDGNNILHRAIFGEYFDLALEIIYLYPSLVSLRNVSGETALHILASKPSAFKSGSHVRFLDGFVYACVIIDSLEVKYPTSKARIKYLVSEQHHQDTKSEFPKNYGICVDIFVMFKKVLKVVFANRCRRKTTKDDSSQGHCEDGLQFDHYDEDGIGKGSGLPPNYLTCFNFIKTIMKFFLIILGIGFRRVERIKRKKKKHMYAKQIMVELVKKASNWEYENDGRKPPKDGEFNMSTFPRKEDDNEASAPHANKINHSSNDTNAKQQEIGPQKETPVLLAAKMGILEIVKKIVEDIPIAIQDLDSEHRNIVLIAAKYRQPHIYRYMLERGKMRECLFGMMDKNGDTALHLAASLFDKNHPWNIPGAALQMHWEIKWYKFVKNSMELNFFAPFNDNAQTARDIFTEHHKDLMAEGAKWLSETSQSCSVVAALIATVAFASATTIPGGVKSDSGIPALEGQLAFDVFAISSLIALCFSVTSLVMFLSILTSRYQEKDFDSNLPVKLIIGLTSLFMSIASMMVAFCGGHFYLIENKLKFAAFPIYMVLCIPVTLFAMAQFPLYFDLIKAIITHVPERTYKRRSL